MENIAPILIATSAGIVFALGALHLLYTWSGDKFRPRDSELEARMKAISPMLTRETTMWRAWTGFDASHGLGAMLFGAVYADLAIGEHEVLFASPLLLSIGWGFLAALVWLARRYWFSIPFRGISCAALLYSVALGLHWA